MSHLFSPRGHVCWSHEHAAQDRQWKQVTFSNFYEPRLSIPVYAETLETASLLP